MRDRLAHLARHRRVEDRHDERHVGVVVAHEQRHPQRERVLARGHADHVEAAVRSAARTHSSSAIDAGSRTSAPPASSASHDLLREVAVAHQEHAHRGGPYTGVERSPRVAGRLTVAEIASSATDSCARRVGREGSEDGVWKALRAGGRDHGDGRAGGRSSATSSASAAPLPPKGATFPGVAPRRRRRRRPRCRRSSTAWRRPSSPPARRTRSTTSCGSSRTSTPTATARRTACTSTSRARGRPTPTA